MCVCVCTVEGGHDCFHVIETWTKIASEQKIVLCRVLGKRLSHCLSIRLLRNGERREPAGNLGIKGCGEVELECLKNEAAIGLVPGSCSHVLLSAACMPPFWASWKSVGWLLWELMGAAGSGRRKVLGIDSKITGEQSFFPSLWLPCLLFFDLIN